MQLASFKVTKLLHKKLGDKFSSMGHFYISIISTMVEGIFIISVITTFSTSTISTMVESFTVVVITV